MLSDINPGAAGANPVGLVLSGGWLYFGAEDGAHGRELWRTDGTPAGTVLVVDIEPGPAGSDPINFIDTYAGLYFSASAGGFGRELWADDRIGWVHPAGRRQRAGFGIFRSNPA